MVAYKGIPGRMRRGRRGGAWLGVSVPPVSVDDMWVGELVGGWAREWRGIRVGMAEKGLSQGSGSRGAG